MKATSVVLLCTLALLGFAVTTLAAEETSDVHQQHAQHLKEVFTCPMHPEIRRPEPGLCPICGMTLVPTPATEADQLLLHEQEPTKLPMTDHTTLDHAGHALTSKETQEPPAAEGETMYTCAMHPQIRQPEPGSCPICGMTLVPIEPTSETLPKSTVDGFAAIKITPEQQWLIGVKTSPVVKEELVHRLRTVGTVAYDPKLYVAQKEYLETVKTGRASGSSSIIQAAQRKLTLSGMTLEQIQALRRRGTVDESLFLTEGTGKAWVYSAIYESERPMLRRGLQVELQTVGHPQNVYKGIIDAIIPIVDPMTRTMTVRSTVLDAIDFLKPGMFVDVYIEIPLGLALTVPKSAVLQTGLRNIVMIARGEGIFEPREVIMGNESVDKYQIISGLEEGATVVTSANFLIDSESQLRGAFSKTGGEHQHGQ